MAVTISTNPVKIIQPIIECKIYVGHYDVMFYNKVCHVTIPSTLCMTKHHGLTCILTIRYRRCVTLLTTSVKGKIHLKTFLESPSYLIYNK